MKHLITIYLIKEEFNKVMVSEILIKAYLKIFIKR
jgi:hypothetical protein